MLRPNTPLERVIPWVDVVPDVAPSSSLRSVEPFLWAATRFQGESPRVAFLCRSHALALANKIKITPCPRVAKFKSDLSSRLIEDSTPSLQKRVKDTDAEELRSLILQYRNKDIRTADLSHPDYLPSLYALQRFIALLSQVLSALTRGSEDIGVEDGQVHHHKKILGEYPLSEEKALAEKVVFGGPSWKEDKMKISYQGLSSTASHGKASRSSSKQDWKFSLWKVVSNGTSKEWMGGEGAEGAEIQGGRIWDLMEYKDIEEEFFECSSSPLVD